MKKLSIILFSLVLVIIVLSGTNSSQAASKSSPSCLIAKENVRKQQDRFRDGLKDLKNSKEAVIGDIQDNTEAIIKLSGYSRELKILKDRYDYYKDEVFPDNRNKLKIKISKLNSKIQSTIYQLKTIKQKTKEDNSQLGKDARYLYSLEKELDNIKKEAKRICK